MKELVSFLLVAISATAADSTMPGEITTPYPTLTNLAVEWRTGKTGRLPQRERKGGLRRDRPDEPEAGLSGRWHRERDGVS
jgi:hypothetical protein